MGAGFSLAARQVKANSCCRWGQREAASAAAAPRRRKAFPGKQRTIAQGLRIGAGLPVPKATASAEPEPGAVIPLPGNLACNDFSAARPVSSKVRNRAANRRL